MKERTTRVGVRELRNGLSSYNAEFLAAVQATPEAILFASDRPAWRTIAFNGYMHYLDFADDIRARVTRPDRPHGSVTS